MSTQGIKKSVFIQEKRTAQHFVEALEQAEEWNLKEWNVNIDCKEIQKNELEKMF